MSKSDLDAIDKENGIISLTINKANNSEIKSRAKKKEL